ncbi:MAG: chemotaxis protein CheB [Microcoleus sp.]
MFSGNITRIGNSDASGFDMTGGILEQGVALIAPGDDRRVLEKHGFGVQIRTNQQPPENYCRPAVDVLFRSTAKIYRGGVLALVLTGMNKMDFTAARVFGKLEAKF